MNEPDNQIRIEDVRDPAQLKVIENLAWQIFPRTYEELIPAQQIPYMMRLMYDDSVLRKEFASGMSFAIIWDGEVPIGYISWHQTEIDGSKVMRLEKLYLDFACHGRSIGNLGIRHVIEAAGYAGAKYISLNVHKRNIRAQKAYCRAGFYRWHKEKESIGNGFIKDDYVMRYDLTEKSSA